MEKKGFYSKWNDYDFMLGVESVCIVNIRSVGHFYVILQGFLNILLYRLHMDAIEGAMSWADFSKS